jgi:hypothetical protein
MEQRPVVFESRELIIILEPKDRTVIGGWRRQHEELHDLCSSQSTIRMIKSKRKTWTLYIACMDEAINAQRILVGRPEEMPAWCNKFEDGRTAPNDDPEVHRARPRT